MPQSDGIPVFAVKFIRRDKTIFCARDQFVLDAAHANGIKLPFSCHNGVCGTCKCRLASGRVDMRHAGGIRSDEIENGMFLPCCSKPLTDLEVDR